jgi:hypothetical protein
MEVSFAFGRRERGTALMASYVAFRHVTIARLRHGSIHDRRGFHACVARIRVEVESVPVPF